MAYYDLPNELWVLVCEILVALDELDDIASPTVRNALQNCHLRAWAFTYIGTSCSLQRLAMTCRLLREAALTIEKKTLIYPNAKTKKSEPRFEDWTKNYLRRSKPQSQLYVTGVSISPAADSSFALRATAITNLVFGLLTVLPGLKLVHLERTVLSAKLCHLLAEMKLVELVLEDCSVTDEELGLPRTWTSLQVVRLNKILSGNARYLFFLVSSITHLSIDSNILSSVAQCPPLPHLRELVIHERLRSGLNNMSHNLKQLLQSTPLLRGLFIYGTFPYWHPTYADSKIAPLPELRELRCGLQAFSQFIPGSPIQTVEIEDPGYPPEAWTKFGRFLARSSIPIKSVSIVPSPSSPIEALGIVISYIPDLENIQCVSTNSIEGLRSRLHFMKKARNLKKVEIFLADDVEFRYWSETRALLRAQFGFLPHLEEISISSPSEQVDMPRKQTKKFSLPSLKSIMGLNF